jgi:hypothetical protein
VFFLSAREDIFLSGAVTLRSADLANILIYVLSFTVGLGTLKRDVLNVTARCVLPTSRTTLYNERDFGVGVTVPNLSFRSFPLGGGEYML